MQAPYSRQSPQIAKGPLSPSGFLFSENAQCLLVRRAPLDRATQVYVPKSLRTDILTLELEPAHAG